MNRRLPNARIILLALCCMVTTTLSWGQISNEAVHEGVIRIKVKPELVASSELSTTKSQGIALTGVPSLDRLCRKYAASNIERVFPYNALNEERHRKHGLHLWYEIRFASNEDAKKVASAYAGLGEVSQAEPLYKTKLITGKINAVDNSAAATGAMPFNDPYLPKQWHYHNVGDNDGLAGSDINLFEAWKITAGTPNVVVSVHDEGVDYTHEDLAANMWKNMAEFNGAAGVDDDHNGFVDDVYGYNFASHTGAIDKMEHGTHVSGTIAAVNNNGKGVSGVAGGTGNGDGVRIMSCQILGTQTSNIPASYIYAADNGSLISQNSWGYTVAGNYEQATLDAIDYFIAEAGNFAGSPMKGGVVIFAAGNDNADEPNYPGYYENVVAVSALGPNSARSWYSNFGAWVDIASYGGDDTKHSVNQVLSTIPNNGYAYMQGTSMATPHVSGIAALILSKFGSPTFTNKQLLIHLLTGVRDVNSFNPDYAGQLGGGISDAALALASDAGVGPVKITNLNLTGISQDFATLEWTVPVDQDDHRPQQYKIYYNTDSITANNLAGSLVVTVPNNQEPGETVQYEVEGLQSTTRYYFVVVSTDRWGNNSPMSNEVNGVTNEGPTIGMDKTEIDFALDIAQSSMAADSFHILNSGAGVLKWTAVFRHKNLYLPYNKSKLQYPTAGAKASSVNLTIGKQRATARPAGVPIGGDTFQPTTKTYWDPYGPTYVIGDEDLTLTNSSAIRYSVTEDAGFNLTQVQAYLTHDNNRGPMIMEVYLGSSLQTATLTLAQEVTSYSKEGYWHYVDLDDNIYLEKGTDFWIVFHVPAGNKYPLAMGLELESSMSDNCFYSNDLGKTWTPLAKAVSDDRWVYIIDAISGQPTLGNYISVTPAESTVLSGGAESVTVSVDGTTLKNGSYTADVVFNSNDKNNQLVKLPINLEVTNHQPILQVADISDFGSVFVGTEKTIEVTVSNLGYGDFSQVNLTISDPQFQLVDYAPWKIAARMVETIKFKYKPSGPGNGNATVTLTDVNSNAHQFYLNGVGSMPPVINLNPAQVTVNSIKLGDEFTTSFNIQNTGQYPLKYVFPKYADDNTLSEFGTNVQKFGYTTDINLDGTGQPAYNFTDISSEPNIIGNFHYQQNEFYEVDLGFDFPYYGQTFSKVYITALGAVSFANDGVLNRSSGRIGDPSLPSGYVTAAWWPFDPAQGGGIHFQHQPGKLIVEYKNIVYYDPYLGKFPATFEFVFYDNGNIDIAYGDLSSWDPFFLSYFLAGIDDPAHKDGLMISDVEFPIGITSNSIIRINNPSVGALKSVSSISGVVAVGGSQAIDLTFATAGLKEGSFTEYVNIFSNDPFNNPTKEKVDFNITTGGVAQMSVDKDTIDLGTVFRTAVVNGSVAIINSGTKDITITSMTIPGGKYTLDKAAPFVVKAKQTQFVKATLKTNATGTFNANWTIKNNKAQTFVVHLFSKVIMEPIVAVDVPSIDKQLESGDSTKVTVTVTNSGQSPLEFVTLGTDWLYVPEDTAATNKTYSWMLSTTAGGPTFNWIDILKTGVKIDSLDSFENTHAWKAVKLPFSFRFYGKKYDTLYIGANGLMSFTSDPYGHPFPSDKIPTTDSPNNFIAPLWITGWVDGFAQDGGVYYQLYSDKIVVTYSQMINNFWMGDDITYQAILYSNGNIKLQYNKPNNDETSNQGLIGLENFDGSDGVTISNRQYFVTDKLAIILQPASKEIVPAVSTKKIDVVVDARYLYAGSYSANLVLQNNTPANPQLQIPATLTVTGLPALTMPDSIAFGKVMPYMEADEYGVFSDKSYFQYFDLINTGKDNAIVSAFTMKGGSPELVVETQVEDPFFGGFYWTDVTYLYDPLTIAPATRASLRVRLTPQAPAHMLSDTLALSTNLPAGTISLPISATVVMPPVLNLDTDHITVQFDTVGQSKTRQFVVDNNTGASMLTYSMSIEYLRAKPTATSVNTSKTTKTAAQTSGRITSQSAVLTAAPHTANETVARAAGTLSAGLSQYNRLLQYDTLSKPTSQIGFNGSSEFWCASKFTSPDNGFTLSHVITWFAPGEWLNSKIMIDVLGGSEDINQAQVISSQEFDYTVTDPDIHGKFIEIALNKSLSFYPNEKFFVVVKYQLGLTYPQGTALLNQNLTNTFFYSTGDGTYRDLTTAGFASNGWMIKAAEKTATTVGWASLTTMSDSLDAGTQRSVDVGFDSKKAPEADNYAYVNISSNDPYHKTAKVLLLLHKNQGPVFQNGEQVDLTVAENDTLQYTVVASDVEGDAFTYALAMPYNKVKLDQSGGQPVLTFVTDYDMQGEYEFLIKATDAFDNVSIQKLEVTVTNVNRAPVVFKSIPTKNYYKGEEAERIDLREYIKDPDGDVLDFATVSTNDTIALIFASGPQIMVSPEGVGNGQIRTTVTDAYGASLTYSFDVHVDAVAGLDSKGATFSVVAYPNPTANKVYVHITGEINPYYNIRVMNVLGMNLLEMSNTSGTGADSEIDMSKLSTGVYFIEVRDNSGSTVRRVIKE